MASPRNDLGAIGSGGSFQGLSAADFNAYETKKWTSNAFTLERRKGKDKLLALARAVRSEVEEELEGLELGASDEAPTVANGRKVEALWVFFTRGSDERASLRTLLQRTNLQAGAQLFDIAVQHQHLCLALRLDQRGLALSIELATKAKVDRENAIEKLKPAWAQEKVVELCHNLPGGTVIGPKSNQRDALEITSADVESWIPGLQSDDQAFGAELLLARTEEVLASDNLIGTLAAQLALFVPLYRFLAWSKDNDQRQVKSTLQKELADRQKKALPTFDSGERVTILTGLFAGRQGYFAEVDPKGRAKVMVGPVSVSVDVKDLKGAS